MAGYIELHCHSNFSLLDGASHVEELANQAHELGMDALALTDHDAVYGAVRFVQAAQAYNIRPILGTELTLTTGHHLTLLVENRAGWNNLCWLITKARHNASKGQAALPPACLTDHIEGIIVLSGCRKGEVAEALLRKDRSASFRAACHYRDLCGPDHFWIELQHHYRQEDDGLIDELVSLARRLKVGYVATNNVHYAVRERQRLQDVLVCIRHRTGLDEAGSLLRPNSEFYLKPHNEMHNLFEDYPLALANTCRIAEDCQFELSYGIQDLPVFPTPAGISAEMQLRHLCEEAISERTSEPTPRIQNQLAHELSIIERAGLANYFLIIWDIVRFARIEGIRCQGRGSAANSLVAYLLGITPIDPLSHGLVFERFLSAERQTAPDIDIDFQADRREEVIQYIYERYGPEHTAMACTLVTFRTRSALRDVGKALGLSESVLRQGERALRKEEPDEQPDAGPESEESLNMLLELSQQIGGFPRHLGIHNGGMIVTGLPLNERVPTEPATMEGRVVVQWDKESLEDAGLIKIDILGLRMLSAIAEALDIIEQTIGERICLERLSFDDSAVYDLLARADTIGTFQVESRAQAQVLPRLKPRCFEDVVVSISLIRPGPLQGNMVHPYLRRRKGEEPVTFSHPSLKPALTETLGVILFQEQVLKVARDLADFTPGQGELLRRALGGKRAGEAIERLRSDFLAGAQGRGVSQEVAENVFEQLKAFGGYSFPKSHAAAFAVLVYQSAWLKVYHPAAFYAALLNNQPMGFWSPAVLVRDARRHGVVVLRVDIHRSRSRCFVEGNEIRLGFRYIDGLGEKGVSRLERARTRKTFVGLADFCRRTRLARRLVENLILVGAMDVWGIQRRKLLWELGKLRYEEDELDLAFPDDQVELAPVSQAEAMAAEYGILGLSTEDHVISLYRPWLKEEGILDSHEVESCKDGQKVRVAGLAVIHQAPPTAKGHHFITLEDEMGLMNVIVRPNVYQRHQHILQGALLLIVEGVAQCRDGVTNILAWQLANMPRIVGS